MLHYEPSIGTKNNKFNIIIVIIMIALMIDMYGYWHDILKQLRIAINTLTN